MKKIIILTALSIVVFNVSHAQISKGSTLLGGDLSLGFGKSKKDTLSADRNNFSFTPVFAKAIKENLFIGGYAGFGISKEGSIPYLNYTSKVNTYSGGLLIRKYLPIKNGFYVFGQANLGVSFIKQKYNNGNPSYQNDQQSTSIGISVNPGISYAVTKKLHLEAGFNNLVGLYYSSSKMEYNNGIDLPTVTKNNGISLNTSLNNMSSQLFLGFRVLLQKGKK